MLPSYNQFATFGSKNFQLAIIPQHSYKVLNVSLVAKHFTYKIVLASNSLNNFICSLPEIFKSENLFFLKLAKNNKKLI